MNIYTIHTPSHSKWFEIMEASLQASCKDYKLISRTTKQVCSPDWGSNDIVNFYYLKALYILEALYTESEPFLYCDVDIYFFRNFIPHLKKQLGKRDAVAQYEKQTFWLFPTICSGFIYMKPNGQMKKLYKKALSKLHKIKSEQKALNRYIHPFVNVGFLPKTYYQINYDNGNKVWDGEEVDITVKNPYLFHYHWTIGDSNRIKLLDYVKQKYE